MLNIQSLWRKRESVIVTWLVSYSAVLFVPILISLVIYAQANAALKSEIHRANDSLLKQMRYTIDTQIDLMKRLNMEMTWSPNLQTLMYSTQSEAEAPYTAYQLVKEFRLFKTSYATIDEFYVVWKKGDAILRAGNIRDLPTAFHTIHQTGAMSMEAWERLVLEADTNRFVVLPHLNAGPAESSIAYVTQLPPNLNGQETGAVVVMTDTSRFQQAIEGISGFSEGLLLILNQNNEVLMTNRNNADVLLPFMDGNRVRLDQAQTGESELFYMDSAISDLKYALIIPSGLYWEKAVNVRNFTYVSILVSLVGAGVLTWFFMRRNYSPIQQLVESLTDKTTQTLPGETNELRFIQNMILRTRSEKNEIAQQLQKHQQVLRSNLIYRLLKGKTDPLVPYEESFRSFQMSLHSLDFAVILFVIENEDHLYDKLPGVGLNERSKLIQLIISNVVEELVESRGHAGYVAEADEMMVCLVNLRTDSSRWSQELSEIAVEAQRFLERYDMELTISISGRHSSWIGIHEAYQEAVDAMEYKMVLGKKGIIAYGDIRQESADGPYGYDYPLQAEQQLINLMKAGDAEQAGSYMNEIMKRNLEQPVMSLNVAKCLMFNLVSTMIKVIHEIGGHDDDERLAGYPLWIDDVLACDTVQEMQSALHGLLEEVCTFAAAKRVSHLSREREDSLRSLSEQVTAYIAARYSDVNLNVNAIGDHFGMKGSYLSKLYKNQTGEGLLDSIHRSRIEKAKELMRFQTDSISELSKVVGYNDAATFIRVFKKYEGITPGRYKEISGMNGKEATG
ncbi:helix-turn-helix domain-containing protein [Paenibacillus sp. DXFW5]|uniref:Helix-turn-helix domain-containing protein n=1 Tax=Paenibacillus rhizolycopersici TaxID=2780073 RepID=A0ABS2H5I7_9BACL|nr:helix-turn-helix domain-containing protein [Paenibacillus rhizolycopersici]MBM6996717.1 helix-turn-helix domain-containing protein [Paenibacillus rhizolycopersici]